MKYGALLLLVACDAYPRVRENPDVPGSVLAGTVIIDDAVTLGHAVVLMSSETSPQPPLGVGSPVSFVGISSTNFAPGTSGAVSAPFALTDVPVGSWYLFGLMDVDGDFNPGVSALASPGCGDLGGWHQDRIEGGAPDPVTIDERELVGGLLVGPLRPIDEPRPAFTVEGPTAVGTGAVVRLSAVDVDQAFADQRITVPAPASGEPCAAGFRFVRRDADADGSADTSPLLPLFEDRWPRVLFVWLGEPVETEDGTAFDRGGISEDVTIAALGNPVPVGVPLPAPGERVEVTALDVAWTDFGQRVEADGSSVVIAGADFPAGAWSATVITEVGQIWTLPNEVGAGLAMGATLPPPGRDGDGDERQGRTFTLTR